MQPPRRIRVPGKPALTTTKREVVEAPRPSRGPQAPASSAGMVYLDERYLNILEMLREAEAPRRPLQYLAAPDPVGHLPESYHTINILRLTTQPLLIGHLTGFICNGAPIRILSEAGHYNRNDMYNAVWFMRSLRISSEDVNRDYDRSDPMFSMELVSR